MPEVVTKPILKTILKKELKKELSASEKRMRSEFSSELSASGKRSDSKLSAQIARMEAKMMTKDDLDAAVQEIVQTVNDAFSSVPTRTEFYGLERRVNTLERKVRT